MSRSRGRRAALLLPVIDPLHFAGLHVDDGEARGALAVADVGAAGDVLGVDAVGDEVGDDGVLGGRGGSFEDAGDHVLFVGRELQAAGGLARLQGEGLASAASCAARFFCCSSRCSTRSRTTWRSSFCSFLRYSWLSVPRASGVRRRRCRGSAGAASAALSASAAAEAASSAAGRGRGAGGGRGRGADVGELHEQAAIQRHHVEVAVAREGNALAVLREAGIGFGVGGLGELRDLAGGRCRR